MFVAKTEINVTKEECLGKKIEQHDNQYPHFRTNISNYYY